MPSFRSIVLFATTALVAFSSASPVAEANAVRAANGASTFQTLSSILDNTNTQLNSVLAQSKQIAASNKVVDVATVTPHINAVKTIVSDATTAIKQLQGQALVYPAGQSNATFVQQIAQFLQTIASIVSTTISNVGGSTTASGQSVTSTAASAIGLPVGVLLLIVEGIVGAILPPTIPLLAGVIPTLLLLGLGPVLGIIL